jgi:hypothetical protein
VSIYDDNIQYLKQKFPHLLQVLNAAPVARGRTVPAKNGSLTLVYRHHDSSFYLHSRFNPEQESLKILKNKNLEADHIVVFGLGLGYHLEKLMALKEPLSRVFLVEPEIEMFRHSLATVRWNQLLERRDFFYAVGTDLGTVAENLHRFLNISVFDKMEFVELASETRIFQSFFNKARDSIEMEVKANLYDFKTRLAESYMSPRNVLGNLQWILKTRPIAHLKDAFRGTGTAGFIVSAGPSLDRNVLQLKKIRDRGMLVAVDTALKPLLKRSLHPHFTAIGDPSHKNYLHLQGTETELRHFIAAEAGIAGRVFRDFQDKVFTLSIGKSIVRMIEAHSEPLGEIEAWGSVISIALAFAVYIGLDPIIFVGQDFAFTDSRNHCRGTSWEDDKMEYSQDLDELQRFEKKSISGNKKVLEIKDVNGRVTMTSERLVLYKNYLARLVTRFPHIRFFNATEGGIFSEIPSISLAQAIEKYVYGRPALDLERLHRLPTMENEKNISQLRDFFQRTGQFFDDYRNELDDALTLIDSSRNILPHEVLPVLQQLEKTHQALYSSIEKGEIVEMWSASPMYHFLRNYNRIRGRQLDKNTIDKTLNLYRSYYRNIKPMVEDIVKQFDKTARRLN